MCNSPFDGELLYYLDDKEFSMNVNDSDYPLAKDRWASCFTEDCL